MSKAIEFSAAALKDTKFLTAEEGGAFTCLNFSGGLCLYLW
jgi:hypothetical protein